jgi:hypothetical protein
MGLDWTNMSAPAELQPPPRVWADPLQRMPKLDLSAAKAPKPVARTHFGTEIAFASSIIGAVLIILGVAVGVIAVWPNATCAVAALIGLAVVVRAL